MRHCPQLGTARSQTSVGNARRIQASHRPSRGGRVDSGTPRALEASGRVQPTAQARTYAVRARDQQDAPDVIVGKLSLLSIDVFALFDPGSTHSYICSSIASRKGMIVEQLAFDIVVTNLLGHSVVVNQVYRAVPIQVESVVLPADLIDLPFQEFDLILGMD